MAANAAQTAATEKDKNSICNELLCTCIVTYASKYGLSPSWPLLVQLQWRYESMSLWPDNTVPRILNSFPKIGCWWTWYSSHTQVFTLPEMQEEKGKQKITHSIWLFIKPRSSAHKANILPKKTRSSTLFISPSIRHILRPVTDITKQNLSIISEVFPKLHL